MKLLLSLLTLLVGVLTVRPAILVTPVPATFSTLEGAEYLGRSFLHVGGTFDIWTPNDVADNLPEKSYTGLLPAFKAGSVGSVSLDTSRGANQLWAGYADIQYIISGLPQKAPNALVLEIRGDIVLNVAGHRLNQGQYWIRNDDGTPLGRLQMPTAVLTSDPNAGVGSWMFQANQQALQSVPEPTVLVPAGLFALLLGLNRRRTRI